MSWLDVEIERLTEPGYLAGIESIAIDALRSMRSECQQAEVTVSYLRRVAQGRLDIVGAYMNGIDSASGLDSLIEELPRIIAGPVRPPGPGRLPAQFAPDAAGMELTGEIDVIFGPDEVGKLPSMGQEELAEIASNLAKVETKLSAQRHELHKQIDGIQAEIVHRYKTGEASVDSLVP